MPTADELERLIVVLVGTRNPLNIGAAARAMSNFGLSRLRVVNPYKLPFREARSAVGASAVLANGEEYDRVEEAISDCTLVVGTTAAHKREIQHPLRPLEAGARLIRTNLVSGQVALLFGSEKRGLSNEDLSHCQWLMRIPTRQGHPSMNLGQAVAVCCYELARRAGPESHRKGPSRATAGDLERFTGLLLETLRASGYVRPRTDRATATRVRRLVRSLHMPAEDAEVWMGMLRQILWKVGK